MLSDLEAVISVCVLMGSIFFTFGYGMGFFSGRKIVPFQKLGAGGYIVIGAVSDPSKALYAVQEEGKSGVGFIIDLGEVSRIDTERLVPGTVFHIVNGIGSRKSLSVSNSS